MQSQASIEPYNDQLASLVIDVNKNGITEDKVRSGGPRTGKSPLSNFGALLDPPHSMAL